MTVVVTHTTPADSTFSSTGAAAWNANHALSGVGTMAEQDANSVAITGGTINGTTVGATTPAAGTFTTLTAQTEVLKGTGQNLLTYSNTFTNANWNKAAVTIATSGTTDPFGGTSAFTLIPTAANVEHTLYQGNLNTVVGVTNTFSCYIKANGYNFAFLRTFDYTANFTQSLVMFNLSTGAVGTITGSNTTASITAVGNGWYRCLCIFSSVQNGPFRSLQIGASPTDTNTNVFNGDGTSGIFIYASQLEFGSTANTYIPTTTTAVYGTPTLSFSGVSTIGLESNGSLFVQPAGTGALQAQATTSSAVGGNARGANAVDWQTSRASASNVASGQLSAIGGGYGNISSGFASVVSGGQSNTASSSYAVVSGYQNTVTGPFSSNSGGQSNASTGYYNFIGAGFTNSGTANASVTTQSATMNGTTAVTLSGSNGSIKVGQYIAGTSIASDTYVAAISGTSLTLSKVASGSSTSTLSFFTPHGIVVGGGNNQATGSYSFIGGGGDAGSSANRNVASGDWSFVGGGQKNVASANYAAIAGGTNNTASGVGAFIGGGGFDGATISANSVSGLSAVVSGGMGNNASGYNATISGGRQNQANSTAGTVTGGGYGTSRGITGYTVSPASFSPIGTFVVGTSQTALLVLGKQTTDATATVVTSDGGAAGTTNQVILPPNSAYYFKGSVIANVTGAANGAAWEFSGAIMRGANAASTVLIGTPAINRVAATAGATAWVIALTADTTNGGLAVTVTGAASTTIRWVSSISTTEVTF